MKKWLGVLIKKVNFVKFWLEVSISEPIENKLWLSRLGRTNQWYKNASFRRYWLVHSLGEGKSYPAALHRIPTQTVDSSQFSERWILQRQPKIINNIKTSWDENTIKDLEQVCPKQAHDFLSWLLTLKTILPRVLSSFWSVICLVSSIFQ